MNVPEETPLVRLVYKSRSAMRGTGSEIQQAFDEVLETSRRRNSEAGVTGALLFTRFTFVQALEGPADLIEVTFDRICCDLRHTGLEIIEYGSIDAPSFGLWSMSHLVPDDATEAMLNSTTSEMELGDAAASALKLMANLLRRSEVNECELRAA